MELECNPRGFVPLEIGKPQPCRDRPGTGPFEQHFILVPLLIPPGTRTRGRKALATDWAASALAWLCA
eukprot:2119449-Rhodomonas_salina.1